MSFWLERFDGVELPLIEAEQDIGAVGTRTAYFDLPGGGAFDAYGSKVAPRGQYTLSATGEIGNLTTQAEMQVQFDALRALRGRRGKLYARMDDGTVRWVWARLPSIPMRRGVDNVLYLLASLQFDVTSPVWYGDRHGSGWTFDSGELFDTGLVFDEATGDVTTLIHGVGTDVVATNDGNTPITNAVLTLTPGGSAITGATFVVTEADGTAQVDITYSGTVAVGQVLIIDAGAKAAYIPTTLTVAGVATDTALTVTSSAGFVVGRSIAIDLFNGNIWNTTITGTPTGTTITIDDALPSGTTSSASVRMSAYDDLVFGDGHRIPEWLRIEPPSTTIVTTITSTNNGTLTTAYADAWE